MSYDEKDAIAENKEDIKCKIEQFIIISQVIRENSF
jgi:hypothetical protein